MGRIDLDGVRVGGLGHEALCGRWDVAVLGGDQSPGGDGLPGGPGGLLPGPRRLLGVTGRPAQRVGGSDDRIPGLLQAAHHSVPAGTVGEGTVPPARVWASRPLHHHPPKSGCRRERAQGGDGDPAQREQRVCERIPGPPAREIPLGSVPPNRSLGRAELMSPSTERGSRSMARSPKETTPTGWSPSITGTRRTARSRISPMT